MDQQQKQNISQASEQLTDSTQQVFRTMADRVVSLQESNLKLTQNFFQNWVEQVNNQAQGAREATENLRDQSSRQREAVETLSQEGAHDSGSRLFHEAVLSASQVTKRVLGDPGHGFYLPESAGIQDKSEDVESSPAGGIVNATDFPQRFRRYGYGCSGLCPGQRLGPSSLLVTRGIGQSDLLLEKGLLPSEVAL